VPATGHRTVTVAAVGAGRRDRQWLFGLVLLQSALTQLVVFVIRPTVSYRALELDVPAQWLGLLSASFALVPLLLAVPSGQAADRFGERRVLLVGAGLLVVAGLVFVWRGHDVAGLVVANVVLGTGHLCCMVGQQALIANTARPGTYDTAFGYYTFSASLGQSVGPGLIVAFGGRNLIPDTQQIFVGAAVMTGVLFVCTLLIRDPARSSSVERHHDDGVSQLVRLPGLMRAIVISGMVVASVDISVVYLPALGAERELASGVVGLLLTVRAVAAMTTRLFLGRLSRRVGRHRLLVSSLVVSAVGFAVVPIPMPLWALAVVMVIIGIGLGIGTPLTMAWVAEATPSGLRGRAMSLRISGNRLGQVVVPSTVGALAAGLGAAGVLWVTAGALTAAGVAAWGLPPARPLT
jgi:MFS family permease